MTIEEYLMFLEGKKDNYNKLNTMNEIEVQLITLFMSIAIHRYEWKGLPKEIKPYNLEKILNYYGQGVFFKIEGGKYVVASATNQGNLDIYGEPVTVVPIAINGYSFDRVNVSDALDNTGNIVSKNAVLIKNNLNSVPTFFLLKPIIERLCFIWQSLGINEGLSRIKAILHANKDIAGVMKSEINKILGSRNGIAVVSEKVNVLKDIEKVDFNVQYNPSDYWEDFDNTFALACQVTGITTNLKNHKKERLLTGEVESNDELTTITEDTNLEFRKLACESINELFGLSVSVDNKISQAKMTKPSDNSNLDTKNDTPTK